MVIMGHSFCPTTAAPWLPAPSQPLRSWQLRSAYQASLAGSSPLACRPPASHSVQALRLELSAPEKAPPSHLGSATAMTMELRL